MPGKTVARPRSTRPRKVKGEIITANGQHPDVLDVVIDIDQLEIDDLPTIALLNELGSQEMFTSANTDRIIDMLDRAVVGGVRGRHYRLVDLHEIVAALTATFKVARDPETAEGN